VGELRYPEWIAASEVFKTFDKKKKKDEN